MISLRIVGSIFRNNNSSGLFIVRSAISVSSSDIAFNSADERGGGVLSDCSNVALERTSVHQNFANLQGGGIFASCAASRGANIVSAVSFHHCSIFGNRISSGHGADLFEDGAAVDITNSDFSNTSLPSQPHAVVITRSSTSIIASTVAALEVDASRSTFAGDVIFLPPPFVHLSRSHVGAVKAVGVSMTVSSTIVDGPFEVEAHSTIHPVGSVLRNVAISSDGQLWLAMSVLSRVCAAARCVHNLHVGDVPAVMGRDLALVSIGGVSSVEWFDEAPFSYVASCWRTDIATPPLTLAVNASSINGSHVSLDIFDGPVADCLWTATFNPTSFSLKQGGWVVPGGATFTLRRRDGNSLGPSTCCARANVRRLSAALPSVSDIRLSGGAMGSPVIMIGWGLNDVADVALTLRDLSGRDYLARASDFQLSWMERENFSCYSQQEDSARFTCKVKSEAISNGDVFFSFRECPEGFDSLCRATVRNSPPILHVGWVVVPSVLVFGTLVAACVARIKASKRRRLRMRN